MISFCIITNGARPNKTQREIGSIHFTARNVDHEIIVSGICPNELECFDHFVDAKDAAKEGRLGAMRNAAVKLAKADIIVVADDDIVFMPDWVDQMLKVKFDVMASRIMNTDGSRYWDWTVRKPDRQYLIPYTQTDPDIYVTGGFITMKHRVWQQVKWDDSIGFQQAEDVEYSKRIKEAGFKIVMNSDAVVIHNDSRYVQIGDVVGMVK